MTDPDSKILELTAGHGMTELANIWPEMVAIMSAVAIGLALIGQRRK
jgi:hypothetical protein